MKQVIFCTLLCISSLIGYGQNSRNQGIVTDFLSKLPLLPADNISAKQFSSHSPHQQNGDSEHFLYRDKHGDAVIFDVIGTGCIKNMWGTVIDPESIMKFYFDGEENPRYKINTIDFYKGNNLLFPTPLVSYDRRGYYIEDAYAGNSFAPIFFKKSLKISIQGKPTFYHILYETYPYNNNIQTTDRKSHQEFILSAINTSGDDQWKGSNLKEVKQSFDNLNPWQAIDLFKYAESAVIRSLEIEIDSSDLFLQNVYIHMIWDDKSIKNDNNPQKEKLAYEKNEDSHLLNVMAPIGMFFASPHYTINVKSLPLTIEKLPNGRVKLLCNFSMPFWRNARITLFNKSDNTFGRVSSTIRLDNNSYPQNETGYFTTFYRKGITEYGRDWLFYESSGTGWFLGVVQSCRLEHYCEGNEHFYIDGNKTPQINGTGTEDYYLGCFWPNMQYNTPFAGCVNDVRIISGGDPNKFLTIYKEDYLYPAIYYRFHLEMPIPFYSSIDARIQHGGESNIESEYASLAYLYIRKAPKLYETDLINVGNKTSMKYHNYRVNTENKEVLLTAKYEGDYVYTNISDKGLYHKGAGNISFNIAIDPNNSGIKIRRRSDQSVPLQKAKVYIDGKYAGTWYDPQSNDILRWYDSEFEIHPMFTKGKEDLQIMLELDDSKDFSFTDFEYRIFSYIN